MMKVKQCIVTLLIAMGVAVWLSPIHIVEGAPNPVVTISEAPERDSVEIARMCSEVNSELQDEGLFLAPASGASSNNEFLIFFKDNNLINVEINMLRYRDLSQENKQFVIETSLTSIQNSGISRTNKTKLYNFIADSDSSTSSLVRQLSSDVTADFASAYSTFRPFSGTLGWILGLISLIMFVLLGFVVLVDLSYIMFSPLQCWLNKSNPEEKPSIISAEAWKAVKESESKTGVEYVNPLTLYLKHKVGQFIVIFICLLYLVSGKLYGLIATIMDYFNGLIN